MGRIVAIANQKGGVGKTTTAINLAVALADSGSRVLLVDVDPQGNATSGLAHGEPPATHYKRTVYHALVAGAGLGDIIREVRPHLHLAPSGPDLVGAEIELAAVEGRERRLKALLAIAALEYNVVLIDTPPSLGLLTLNALVAADAVLVPMQCEYYALEGLSSLLATIRRVKAVLNPALEVEGLVLTMFDVRNRLSHEVAREVREHFPDKVLRAVVPRSVRFSESPSHGLSLLEYEPRSVGAESYRQLARELREAWDGSITRGDLSVANSGRAASDPDGGRQEGEADGEKTFGAGTRRAHTEHRT